MSTFRTVAVGAIFLWAAASPAADAPPAVQDLVAVHRAGQTFLTWKEVDPLVTTDKTTWGEIKDKLAKAKYACSYRVYGHDKPIAKDTLAAAQLVAEVKPLSAYNVNGRNVEYLIGEAMQKADLPGEQTPGYNGVIHTWHMDHPRMDRYPVTRFVIADGAKPLPVGTGLCVHHPTAAGDRYYAVTTCRNGVENRDAIAALAKPVAETVGSGAPVCQGEGLWGPFFDSPGKRTVYVQWTAPPLTPRPMYFNWSVLVPDDAPKAAPVELYFHSGNYSYARPNQKLLLSSIQIAPHDYPFSGWYGFNDAAGTDKPLENGTVSNHTQRRITAFLDWAQQKLPVDAERIYAVGGDGAAALALAYPDRFAAVYVTGFGADILEPKRQAPYVAAWGPRDPDIKDDQGRGDWAWAELDKLVKPRADLPLFICKGPSWGRVPGYGNGRGKFYTAMQQAKQPHTAIWAWSGTLVVPDRYTGLWRGSDLQRSVAVPAFTNASVDKEGEGSGNANGVLTWKDVRDEPDSFQVTVTTGGAAFDLTPRRLTMFKLKPGDKVQWTAGDDQRGAAVADVNGLVTLMGLKCGKELVVKITRAK